MSNVVRVGVSFYLPLLEDKFIRWNELNQCFFPRMGLGMME